MAHPGGRPRIFKTPDDLLAAFDDYKKWAHNNPWNKMEAIKSGDMAGELIALPTERPLTEVEFAVFCKMSLSCLKTYGNKPEFMTIYEMIKNDMSSQRISGGMSGAYNANLVARIDGLTEKSEVDNTHHYPDKIKVVFE